MSTAGERVQQIREHYGASKQAFARVLGIYIESLTQIESGAIPVSMLTNLQLADKFGAESTWVRFGDGPMLQKGFVLSEKVKRELTKSDEAEEPKGSTKRQWNKAINKTTPASLAGESSQAAGVIPKPSPQPTDARPAPVADAHNNNKRSVDSTSGFAGLDPEYGVGGIERSDPTIRNSSKEKPMKKKSAKCTDPIAAGKELKAMREKAGLGPSAASALTKIPKSTLYNYERGKYGLTEELRVMILTAYDLAKPTIPASAPRKTIPPKTKKTNAAGRTDTDDHGRTPTGREAKIDTGATGLIEAIEIAPRRIDPGRYERADVLELLNRQLDILESVFMGKVG